MLQIRLSKGSSSEGGGAAAAAVAPAKAPAPATETVTVTCPDHLVLADLPVAKSVGAVTSSAATSVRSVGRRHRRQAGEKVHFCVRCDFPIAIYGRITPCEHAFCLTCARSEASCYLNPLSLCHRWGGDHVLLLRGLLLLLRPRHPLPLLPQMLPIRCARRRRDLPYLPRCLCRGDQHPPPPSP